VRKCLVTLTIGDKYKSSFERYLRPNWELYCEKYLIDLVVLDQPLDNSPRAQKRSPAWQKLLILSQDWSFQYEQIAWVDSDIAINANRAPDLFSFVPPDKIGVVEDFAFPTPDMYKYLLQEQYSSWDQQGRSFMRNTTAKEYYTNRGIAVDGFGDVDLCVLQTGVVVSSPKFHKKLFLETYERYEDLYASFGNYEMPAMSFEIYNSGLWKPLPQDFNVIARNFLELIQPASKPKNRLLLLFFKIVQKIMLTHHLRGLFRMIYFTHFADAAYLIRKLP